MCVASIHLRPMEVINKQGVFYLRSHWVQDKLGRVLELK